MRPLPETTRLYDDVRAGRLAPAPGRPPEANRAPPGLPPAPSRADGAPGPASWPLVGRQDELRALHAAWREVGAAGRVVTVVGEAGCGKSRLVEEFRREASRRRAAWCWPTGATTARATLPFVVAADLLRTALSVCPELPARLPAHTAAMAGRLCPELAVAHRDTTRAAAGQPDGADPAVRRDRGGPAGRGDARPGRAAPAGVVVVEDVHWADGPSLDLLAYLARRLAAWPLLLVLSWSSEHAERLRGLRSALSEASDAGRGGGGGTHPAGRGAGPRPAAACGGAGRGRDPAARADAGAADAGPRVRGGAALGGRRRRRALVAARVRPGTAAQAAGGGQRADPADAVHGGRAGQRLRRGPAPGGERPGRARRPWKRSTRRCGGS